MVLSSFHVMFGTTFALLTSCSYLSRRSKRSVLSYFQPRILRLWPRMKPNVRYLHAAKAVVSRCRNEKTCRLLNMFFHLTRTRLPWHLSFFFNGKSERFQSDLDVNAIATKLFVFLSKVCPVSPFFSLFRYFHFITRSTDETIWLSRGRRERKKAILTPLSHVVVSYFC